MLPLDFLRRRAGRQAVTAKFYGWDEGVLVTNSILTRFTVSECTHPRLYQQYQHFPPKDASFDTKLASFLCTHMGCKALVI